RTMLDAPQKTMAPLGDGDAFSCSSNFCMLGSQRFASGAARCCWAPVVATNNRVPIATIPLRWRMLFLLVRLKPDTTTEVSGPTYLLAQCPPLGGPYRWRAQAPPNCARFTSEPRKYTLLIFRELTMLASGLASRT